MSVYRLISEPLYIGCCLYFNILPNHFILHIVSVSRQFTWSLWRIFEQKSTKHSLLNSQYQYFDYFSFTICSISLCKI